MRSDEVNRGASSVLRDNLKKKKKKEKKHGELAELWLQLTFARTAYKSKVCKADWATRADECRGESAIYFPMRARLIIREGKGERD